MENQKKASCFRPGRSGNPRGRARGLRNRKTVVREIAEERHWVTDGGRRQRRSTLELVLIFVRNRSIEGNVKAFRSFHRLMERFEPKGGRGGVIAIPAPVTEAEWLERQERRRQQTQESEEKDRAWLEKIMETPAP